VGPATGTPPGPDYARQPCRPSRPAGFWQLQVTTRRGWPAAGSISSAVLEIVFCFAFVFVFPFFNCESGERRRPRRIESVATGSHHDGRQNSELDSSTRVEARAAVHAAPAHHPPRASTVRPAKRVKRGLARRQRTCEQGHKDRIESTAPRARPRDRVAPRDRAHNAKPPWARVKEGSLEKAQAQAPNESTDKNQRSGQGERGSTRWHAAKSSGPARHRACCRATHCITPGPTRLRSALRWIAAAPGERGQPGPGE